MLNKHYFPNWTDIVPLNQEKRMEMFTNLFRAFLCVSQKLE